MAADVYAAPDAKGRAGWTLYTGSAGWYYRTAVESFLGLRLEGDRLTLSPHLPASMPGYTARIRRKGGEIRIRVERTKDAPGLTVDGEPAGFVPLDGRDHTACLRLPPA